jgi:hypothetical protein
MTYDRILLTSLGIALLGGCTIDKDLLGTSGDASGTDSSGAETTGAASTGEATETTGADEPTDGSESTTGLPEGDPALCAAQTDRAGCEAVEFASGDVFPFCVWMNWTPVTLVGDVCTFGAEQGECVYDVSGSEGCASFETCGKAVGAAWKQEGDQVSLAYGQFCTSAPAGMLCNTEFPDDEVAPECACTCKPGFEP